MYPLNRSRLKVFIFSSILFAPLLKMSCQEQALFRSDALNAALKDPPAPSENTSLWGEEEIEVNLKNPVFTQGVIKTDEGGVILSYDRDIRIQAQHIEYTNRVENGRLVKKVVAEGDLLFQQGMHAFVGTKLEYDFVTRMGTLTNGKTFTGIWYIGGDKIELNPDGTYSLHDAYITTSENQDMAWDISARAVNVSKSHLLAAKNIRIRFIKLPIFWLPSFKMNLKFFTDPPVRYKIRWDKSLGPRATMRYRVFSWEDFNLFFRLDYRLKRGFGSAIESEYYSPDDRTIFLTKSYGANDKTIPSQSGNKRYRLQGLYQWENRDDTTQVFASYDKMSDSKMPGDFKDDDFEVNTQKRSIFIANHREINSLSSFTVQPRLNNFQSLNQQLPLAFGSLRPINLARSGIISENYATAGYLNYVYNRLIAEELPHIHAGRMETRNQIYRPIPFRYLTLTPNAGFYGIYYSNNPFRRSIGQAVFSYGAEANTRLFHTGPKHRHMIEPYLRYTGLTTPTAGLNQHFVFGIDDGFYRLNQLKFGIRNAIFSSNLSPFVPQFVFDLYSYAYFGQTAFNYTIPKAYATFSINRPFYSVTTGLAWNIQQQVLDYSNILSQWTINENLAFVVEFRHRSKYDWRKADHENFILDVARPIDELLRSPISDGRNTLLTRLQVRLAPRWTAHFETHNGWGRRCEPSYTEYRIQLFNTIATSWQVKLSFRRSPDDIEFSPSISIVK